MNRDLAEQLARAFGLDSPADVETLIATLRAGGDVDVKTLRRGCLALVDNVREARAAHQVSDQRLKIALGASELGLWEWNVGTGEVLVDHTYCKFIGRKPGGESWQIADIAALVHPEDRDAFTVAARDVLRGTAKVLQIQQRILHSDGRWVWLETYGAVTDRDANGRALRMSGTHTNIT